MKQPERNTRINKYSILAVMYFFFNGLFMPVGLLFMNLLTPFFYFWLLLKRKKEILRPFLLFLIPFDIIHFIGGVEWSSFIKSNILLASTYIFTYAFAMFVNSYPRLPVLFKQVLVLNFLFTLAAAIVFFTPYRESMWYINKFTASVDRFPRLAMFTYEASYYSLMFVPVAFYYLLKVFFRQNRTSSAALLLLTGLPLLLSFSLGVLGAMLLSFMLLYAIHWRKIFYRKNFMIVLFAFVLAVIFTGIFLALFVPGNPLFIRISNILKGIDTSANGRTIDSFTMAWRVADERSLWTGSGLGQIKILAYDIVKKYYWYWGNVEVVRIPNTMAETFAIFGVAGLIIRFILIFYFFFKTRVLDNYYRTALFIFIFIYQFTGSYITNMVEYVIWVLAFSNVFPAFNVTVVSRKDDPAV